MWLFVFYVHLCLQNCLYKKVCMQVASGNLSSVGSDWQIQISTANGWAGQTEVEGLGFLGQGERGKEKYAMPGEVGERNLRT